MPIKWSAVKVSKAMDAVESQISLAESFLNQAKEKAEEAKSIPNLPQYMLQRLNRVLGDIERLNYVKSSIKAVRDAIPDGAIEAEQESVKHGSQQSLI